MKIELTDRKHWLSIALNVMENIDIVRADKKAKYMAKRNVNWFTKFLYPHPEDSDMYAWMPYSIAESLRDMLQSSGTGVIAINDYDFDCLNNWANLDL